MLHQVFLHSFSTQEKAQKISLLHNFHIDHTFEGKIRTKQLRRIEKTSPGTNVEENLQL